MGFGTSPSPPPPRNLPQELGSVFNVYKTEEPQLAAQAFTQAQQYQPQYLNLNLAGQRQAFDSALSNQQQAIAGSPLLKLLNQQAMSELQTGGKLTPQEVRDVTQQTRAGYAARGNVLGNQALGAELLNRDAATRARLMQEQQFAQGIQSMDLGAVQGLGGAESLATLGGVTGPGYMAGVTAPVSPYLTYGSDLFNTNYNAQAAANIAAANNKAGIQSAAIGSVGKVAGAAIAA